MDKNKKIKAADEYPGVAPNLADDNKVSKQDVRDDVKNLNNNPRNDDLEMP